MRTFLKLVNLLVGAAWTFYLIGSLTQGQGPVVAMQNILGWPTGIFLLIMFIIWLCTPARRRKAKS